MSCTAYDTKTTKNLLHFLRSQTRLISNNKQKKKITTIRISRAELSKLRQPNNYF